VDFFFGVEVFSVAAPGETAPADWPLFIWIMAA
jgi:hypothetical protein